jgi:hypothetical protein
MRHPSIADLARAVNVLTGRNVPGPQSDVWSKHPELGLVVYKVDVVLLVLVFVHRFAVVGVKLSVVGALIARMQRGSVDIDGCT